MRSIATEDCLQQSLKDHDQLKQTMSDKYEAVSNEAQSLLSALQSSPSNDSRDEKAR